jgi:hypothetical protein
MRTAQVLLRLTPEEKEWLEHEARDLGLNPQSLLRMWIAQARKKSRRRVA